MPLNNKQSINHMVARNNLKTSSIERTLQKWLFWLKGIFFKNDFYLSSNKSTILILHLPFWFVT